MQNNEIVIYKPKIKIWYKSHDGSARYVVTDAENRLAIEKELANSKIIKIETATFGVYQFIEIEEYKGETIETLICNQPKYIRDELEIYRKNRYEKIGKTFDDKAHVMRLIEDIKARLDQ